MIMDENKMELIRIRTQQIVNTQIDLTLNVYIEVQWVYGVRNQFLEDLMCKTRIYIFELDYINLST